MNRREFIRLLAATAVTPPLVARAQPPDSVRRIGIFFGGFSETDPESRARIEAFTQRLQELDWIEGRNIKFDLRFGGGDNNRQRAYAAELIGMMPDAIVANSAPAVMALVRQTKTIPVVFANVFDPVASGFVASLARPGGNITGFSNFEPTMAGKWLELLKEIAPGVTRVTAMFERSNPNAEFARIAEQAAPSLHLQYTAAPVSSATDIQNVIHAIVQESNSGLVVIGGTITSANREAIVGLASQHRLPAVYAYRYYVTSGGLLSYGVDSIDIFRRAAGYVDRILKGTKPADLPVQQPTKFELVINMKTAKALGLEVPPTVLARADKVIE
jgi:putative ABC transport system substrate-binding protein